jgi:RHS repeat-associated protein
MNSLNYSYDKNGNRLNSGYQHTDQNRLTTDGVYSYDYDNEGNRTKRTEISTGKVDEYTWDYRNRLTSVVSRDIYGVVTQTVSYEYDVNDLRVKKNVDGSIENYYLDGDNIAFVTDGVGDRAFHYLYGLEADQVLAQDSETGMVWSLADRLGSIDVLVNEHGLIVDQRTYDSFGNTLSQLDPTVKFRFGYTGRESDPETGLYYYRARYFDSNVGRFISTDPIGFEAGDSNLYRYVFNNSTTYTDPSGELGQIAGGAIFGGVFGGLYALANDIETGQFGWNTIGNVTRGAVVGAVAGAVIASGIGLIAAGATSYYGTAVAGAVVNTTVTAGFTAYGAYSSANNFANNRPLTGTLDLIGVGIGAFNVFKGVTKEIPAIRQQEINFRADNARQIYDPGNPQLNSTGAIVPTSSSLTKSTSIPFEINRNIGASIAGILNGPRQNHEFYHGFSIRDINPHPASDGGNLNCVKCAIAVDVTLSGRPAQALPHMAAKTFEEGVSILETTLGGKMIQSSRGDIIYRMNRAQDGARGVVIGYKQGAVYSHAFNVVKQNGKVVFLDGQRGGKAINVDKYDYYFFMRTK